MKNDNKKKTGKTTRKLVLAIVDDEKDILDTLSDQFVRVPSIDLHCFDNANDCWKFLKSGKGLDVLVVDNLLGKDSGRILGNKVIQEFKVPTIMISGNLPPQDKLKRFSSTLAKPFTVDTLLGSIYFALKDKKCIKCQEIQISPIVGVNK